MADYWDNAAFGTTSPAETAAKPPSIWDGLFSGAINSLATLPKRAIDASAQDVQHLGDPNYVRQSIGPALETGMTMMGGSGAIPAEANTLRSGILKPGTGWMAARSESAISPLRSRILDAAHDAAGGQWNARARISDIAAQMPDVPLAALHAEMKQMQRDEVASLMRLDNHPDVTAADKASALAIGNEPRHLLWISKDPRK
jgi:hypothetical protein